MKKKAEIKEMLSKNYARKRKIEDSIIKMSHETDEFYESKMLDKLNSEISALEWVLN
jgi:hypothetical protein